MQKFFTSLLVGVFLFTNCVMAQSEINVYVIPALYGLHQKNKNYNYDSLYAVIKKINPDYIIVEIRQEDMGQDTAYLKKNYPAEMWIMRYWFRNKKHFGMDWLGKEIEGKPIPENYWEETAEIKKWEKELDADTAIQSNLQSCEEIQYKRLPALTNGSFSEITKDEEEKLTLQYYQCFNKTLMNTIHSRISRFYQMRNYTMAERITQVVAENGSGTYVVLAGVDRVPYIKMYLFKLGLGSVLRKG